MRKYVGRFAPSPSGPLHLGSLVCALVSFLHARQANGLWLVRIEDVDVTRVQLGAAECILSQLQAHGLQWDNSVIYQTDRQVAYQAALNQLDSHNLVYACSCTRQAIKANGRYYRGTCRSLNLPSMNNAIRVINETTDTTFLDLHLGEVEVDAELCREDLSIRRKDGLFAYNLAVVVDDIYQKVTHVVRGADLIETTVQQNHLYRLLGETSPKYLHFPVICVEPAKKLSKQNHAKPIENRNAVQNLLQAFILIGLPIDGLSGSMSVEALIAWAVKKWSPKLLAKQREILLSDTNAV